MLVRKARERKRGMETEGKSHLNKDTKEGAERTSFQALFYFFGGLGKPTTNAGGRGTAKGKAMRLRSSGSGMEANVAGK